VRAVRRAKGVVDEYVAHGGHLPGEVDVVLLFPLVEACVFEHEDIAGLEGLTTDKLRMSACNWG
jgi:hypothetical protein